jgi:hypothetical protein
MADVYVFVSSACDGYIDCSRVSPALPIPEVADADPDNLDAPARENLWS